MRTSVRDGLILCIAISGWLINLLVIVEIYGSVHRQEQLLQRIDHKRSISVIELNRIAKTAGERVVMTSGKP